MQISDNINESKIVIPSEMRPADDQSGSARYVINHLLLTLDAVPKADGPAPSRNCLRRGVVPRDCAQGDKPVLDFKLNGNCRAVSAA